MKFCRIIQKEKEIYCCFCFSEKEDIVVTSPRKLKDPDFFCFFLFFLFLFLFLRIFLFFFLGNEFSSLFIFYFLILFSRDNVSCKRQDIYRQHVRRTISYSAINDSILTCRENDIFPNVSLINHELFATTTKVHKTT